MSKLRVHATPGAAVKNLTYTVQVNGVATALAETQPNTAADGSNLVNSVAFAAGDLIGVSVDKSSNGAGTHATNVLATVLVT
jgi:hypothetical protein